MRVVLTYQAGTSNWGSPQASGVAEIIGPEGEARASAHGLTVPSATHLVVWLGKVGTTDSYRLGELSPTGDGNATMDVLLPGAIPNRGWNMVLITAETIATPDHPGNRRSLLGHYPQPIVESPRPAGLPDTGMAPDGG